MPSQQAHDPQYLDEDLHARIAHAVHDIENGADAEATLQQLVLGLQHDHALFREALTDLYQRHPNCLMHGFHMQNLAKDHELAPAFAAALGDRIKKEKEDSVVIVFGGLADNAGFEPGQDFQRIRVLSRHQGYPQDPLADTCRLYHEYGHFLSHRAGFWTADFREANSVFRSQSTRCNAEEATNAGLSDAQKWLILEEEIRAWLLGRPHLLTHRASVRDTYDSVATKSINTYSTKMSVSQANWEQRAVPLDSRGGSSRWAERAAY